jgi:hypothetical protein
METPGGALIKVRRRTWPDAYPTRPAFRRSWGYGSRFKWSVRPDIEVALDVEQLIYEVNTFLNAASMINRLKA